MANHRDGTGSSAYPSAHNGKRSVFKGAWNTFKTVINTDTAAKPATPILDGSYVEVFDDMEVAVVDSNLDRNKERVKQKPVTNLQKKIYDLDFLLELGKKATKAPHPLKFSSDAIKRTYLSIFPHLSKALSSTAYYFYYVMTVTQSRCSIFQRDRRRSRSSHRVALYPQGD